MSIWITGSEGMLGSEVVAESRALGIETIVSDADVDISDMLALGDFAKGKGVDWIVNCAAYTAVDKAEDETEEAFRINATGAGNLAKLARRLSARFLHISTDYVFDGNADRPYGTGDETSPASAYGRSKLEGERAVMKAYPDSIVVRTAWLYGLGGKNFVTTMLRLFNNRSEVKVVDDQRGSPTLANDLAKAIISAVRSPKETSGIYHFTNSGETTWFGFASRVYESARERGIIGKDVKLTPITTREYPTPAQRPAYSVLDCSRFSDDFDFSPRPWQEALDDHLARIAKAR